MAFSDLRRFLQAAEDLGEVKRVDGAHWDVEIGCLTELVTEQEGPLLLFDNIPGYPVGYRVVSNFLGTPKRFALTLGLPTNAAKLEILKAWKEKVRSLTFLPPREVATGPILENQITGAAIDLTKFPAPKWHELDGGRYIGTADVVIVKDPESGWVNLGTYRACIQGPDRLSLWIIDRKHGKVIARKYWEQGKACPVAIVLGCEPATWMGGPAAMPPGVSEYGYAGALRGEPVEVLPGPETGLPIPATAEIVVEGEIPPPEEETAMEGPFGEWPGYYTHTGPETVVRVKRILHRNDPILLGNPPLLPITQRYGIPMFAARIWEHLENSGITDVVGVWTHCHTLMVVISLKQRYQGHATQALIAAAGVLTGADMNRYFVAVDEDIDPTDLRDVLWALCTRAEPAESVQILKGRASDLDPRIHPDRRAQGDLLAGRMLIDACKPFSWRDQFPIANRFDEKTRKQVWEKWGSQMGDVRLP